MKIKTEQISFPFLNDKQIHLSIKRLDKTHKYISGNKWFKLKYNLLEAKRQKARTILTFGGAFSNHIAATAFLGKEEGFNTIGIIRGEEYNPLNPTLSFAKKQGMKLKYLNRYNYKLKNTDNYLDKLKNEFENIYLIPEGGTNKLAIKGTAEIINDNDQHDYVCCAVGTGGTIAGIINSSHENQKILGFPIINGHNILQKEIEKFTNKNCWKLINKYHCGGYAKLSDKLINTINTFYKMFQIPLDGIYTGKMVLGVLDLIKKDYFPKGSTILLIHTGGIQGNIGLNKRFGLKLPTS